MRKPIKQWIAKRLKGIQDRKQLTDVWQEGGITDGKEYAILTNEIYKEWSNMITKLRRRYRKNLEESIVTKKNRMNYQYKDELEIEAK